MVRPKQELLRLAVEDDRVVMDEHAVRQGRGAYVCDAACFEKALAARALPRAFRRPIRIGGNTLGSSDE